MKPNRALITNKGFTLVELLIAMGMFIVVMIIAAESFKTIITQSLKYSRSEESNIEGIIGLEIMRHDLEQMGFGLFWGLIPTHTVTYNEAVTTNWSPDTTNYAKLNDSSSSPPVPRALVGFNGFSNFTSDFIGVKATSVGRSKAAQRWTYIPYKNYSTSDGYESRPVTLPSNNLQASDRVIAVRSNFNNSDDDRLLVDSGGSFFFNYNTTGLIHDDFLPSDPQGLQLHMVYGIKNSGNPAPRMPFNRADFFVNVPAGGTPSFCAPGTGVLYKANVRHEDGRYEYIPLLDCVADMQVVLGWSSNSGAAKIDDGVHGYSSMPSAADYSVTAQTISGSDITAWLQDPQSVREHLKMVKVYILAQEGRRDSSYTYPASSIVVGDASNGEASMTRVYNFSAAQRQYRWKLYRLIVRPKNLVSNQR